LVVVFFFLVRRCTCLHMQVLGIDDDASEADVKSAYRALAKVCHPDISGDERGHNMCIVLNEAYATLSNPDLRREYNQALDEALSDEDDGYTGELLSKWCANSVHFGKNTDPNENRAVFVDELTCIGKYAFLCEKETCTNEC
jgi:DnaJ-class molecular chaperone